jgi:hypothetical protein
MGESKRNGPDARQRTEANTSAERHDVSAQAAGLPFVVQWRNAICAAGCDLSSTQRLIALALSLYADADGSNAFPSERALADATALSERAVRSGLLALIASAWVRREQRIGAGKAWRWNVYTLELPVGAARRSLPMRKGAERDSGPSGEKGAEHGAGASTRSGTSFQMVRNVVPDGPEPRAADLELYQKEHLVRARTREGMYPSDEATKQADAASRARARERLKVPA